MALMIVIHACRVISSNPILNIDLLVQVHPCLHTVSKSGEEKTCWKGRAGKSSEGLDWICDVCTLTKLYK